jgi:Skp family chaperone for outer membrane proteins
MKKVLTVIFMILFSAGSVFSVEKMPADVKAVTDKISKITADYYKSAGKVKSAKELAAVINKYSSEMEKLAPQIKAIEAKYGDMDDDSDTDSDDDMTSAMKDYETVQEEWAKQMSGAEFGDSIVKIQQYYSDPAVQKALQKLSKVMEDIGVSDDEDDDEGNDE